MRNADPVFNEGFLLSDGNEPERNSGIGIKNIVNRLKNIYGENYTFTIKDEAEKQGVQVIYSLPKINKFSGTYV